MYLLLIAEDMSDDQQYKPEAYILSGLLLATAIITVTVAIALIFSIASRKNSKIHRGNYFSGNENPVYDKVQIKTDDTEPNIAHFNT